jgi:hypothetical protein
MENPDLINPSEPIPAHYIADINLRLDALEKKRKRKRFFWLWFPVFLLAGIGFGTYKTYSSNLKVSRAKIQNLQRNTPNVNQHQNLSKTKSTPETKATDNNINQSANNGLPTLTTKANLQANLNNAPFLYSTTQGGAVNPELLSSTPTVLLDSSRIPVDTNGSITWPTAFPKETPLLLIQPIFLISCPALGNLQTQHIESRIKHMIGFSTGVSGIISSFTPIELSVNSFATTPFGSYKNYASARKQAERATSSIDLSFFYRAQKNKWFYQAGIAYNEWGEQIVYSFSSIDGTNRYRYLNFPVFAGYQWTKNKVSLSPMIGLSAGIKLNGKGYYLMPDNGVDIIEAQPFTASGIVQFELAYQMHPFIFHFTPGIRSSIFSPVKSAYTKNHYQAIGCQIGIIYRFEGKTN